MTANWLLDPPKETPFVEWVAGGVTGGLYLLAGLVALCVRGWQDYAVPVFLLMPFAIGFARTVATDGRRALKFAAILFAAWVLPASLFGTVAAAGAFVLVLVIAFPGMILGGVVSAIARRWSRKEVPPGPTLLLLAAVWSSGMLGDAEEVCTPTSDRHGWKPGCDRIPAARGAAWVREGTA